MTITVTTYELTFAFIGAYCGAAIMMFVVIWTDLLRKEQIKSTKLWFRLWMEAKDRADKAEARLAVIHEQHVEAGRKGGKTVHQQYRARIVEVARSLPLQPLRPRDEVIKDNSLLPEKRRAA